MKSISINSINFTLLKFVGFFMGSVLLCVLIINSFRGPLPAQSLQEFKVVALPNENNSEEQQLLQTDLLLHSKWTVVEKLYSEQNTALSGVSAKGDSRADKMVVEAENSFKRTLDSIKRNRSGLVENNKLDSLTSFFEFALKNRQSLQKVKPAINSSTDSLMKKQILSLQDDLQDKNVLVGKLQNQLKSRPVQSNVERTPSLKETKKMRDEIEFLKWALRSEVSSNHALTNSNNRLKQENASLSGQVKGK